MLTSFCLVCTVPCDGRIRNGIIACQACKSFYLRYSSSPEIVTNLKCETGEDNCHIDEQLPTVSDGRRLRFFCKKCRFYKCKAVGMRNLHSQRETKGKEKEKPVAIPQQLSSTVAPVTLAPVVSLHVDKSVAEQILKGIFTSFQNIGNNYDQTPGVVYELGPGSSERDIVSCFLSGGDCGSQIAAFFVKNNPLYKAISLHDRCATFFRGSTRLKRLFSRSPGMLNDNNCQLISYLVPEIKVDLNSFFSKFHFFLIKFNIAQNLRNCCIENGQILQQFQFNFYEYAYLASFLFFYRMGKITNCYLKKN